VVADPHHFDKVQDQVPDHIKDKSRIRIQIKVMRLHNRDFIGFSVSWNLIRSETDVVSYKGERTELKTAAHDNLKSPEQL
jgi:hypothetical protein